MQLFSKIFQKRYIELPILLIGAPIKITYFSQVLLIRGVSYRAPYIKKKLTKNGIQARRICHEVGDIRRAFFETLPTHDQPNRFSVR